MIIDCNMVSEDNNLAMCSKETKPKSEQDCVIFNGIFYLGCSSLNAPRSHTETLKVISILKSPHQEVNNESQSNNALGDTNTCRQQIEVDVSVPNRADGVVRLLESQESNIISTISLCTVLACTQGDKESRDCFALTESRQSTIFRCHVFRCKTPKIVEEITQAFNLAFHNNPKILAKDNNVLAPSAGLPLLRRPSSLSQASSSGHARSDDGSVFCFTVAIEIKEDDGKGSFGSVPWDKSSSSFKFRVNHLKQLNITITQTSNNQLTVNRCFGLLLSPGRNIKQNEMLPIDLDKPLNDSSTSIGAPLLVSGLWDPTYPQFTLLNSETLKGSYVFFSVAVDLMMNEVQDPVRFLVEMQASIHHQNEKLWHFNKKIVSEKFFVRLKEGSNNKQDDPRFGIESIESESQSYRFPSRIASHSNSQTDEEPEEDFDEPLMSGSGTVSMECSPETLEDWGKALQQWRMDLSRRPPLVQKLIRSGSGVPEPLRGEVWQLLSGCVDNENMLEQYRLLIARDSSQESVIQRDIHRTFPAHEYFRESGGEGQDSLYRISKAYSVYDSEVGYSQGSSFLAAALLLHMPEEQAFCVLVKIMFNYKMRDMFKNGFEELHLNFYILDRLIESLMPNLHDHFKQLNIETHMFSSQWFLTLFTAKFPLNMVYHVLDMFLCEGELVVFQVAIALLECCRRELLTLDFEGVLKYFRVHLPKKYRDDNQVTQLALATVKVKVTQKKVARYRKDYQSQKEKIAIEEDPMLRVMKKNKMLMEANMRLELENDEVAQELITCDITLTTQLERTKKHSEDLEKELHAVTDELESMRVKEADLIEENNRLQSEATQVKEMCRREMARQESEIEAKAKIVSDYKTISNQLSERLQVLERNNRKEVAFKRESSESVYEYTYSISDQTMNPETKERLEMLQKHARSLELDLAQTKLKLVESECKVQDLKHELASATKTLQDSKSNTWFPKTLFSLTSSKKADNPANVPAPSKSPSLSEQ